MYGRRRPVIPTADTRVEHILKCLVDMVTYKKKGGAFKDVFYQIKVPIAWRENIKA